MNRKKGFTLIEIMIVIAVIGILSMILVPKVGAIKLQSKNKSVAANVLVVRTYLENRSGKDGSAYQTLMIQNQDSAQTLTTIANIVGADMTSKFFGSNALINPFNSSSAVCPQGNVSSNTSSITSSVQVYYCATALPSSNADIINSGDLPKGTGFEGNVVVVIYSTGYVLYGLDDSGQIINPPYIIKFPPVPSGSGESSGGGGDSGGGTSGNTIADFFGANCLNVFGDSGSQVNLGNGSTNMDITGSAYLQGQQITFQQNTNINGDLNILGTGSGNSVNTGVGNNNTMKVNGKANFQAYDIKFKSNLQTYSNISILGTNSVTFDNAGINAQFDNGSVQIQSNKDINFSSNANLVNSKFSAVASGGNYFTNTSGNLSLDNSSSAYLESGQDTQFYYGVNSASPVTMIAGNNLDFGNNSQSVNINSKTYLKAANTVSILRNVTLGDTYIQANIFSYGHANINTSGLSTHVNSFSHDQNGGTLTPGYVAVPAQQPTAPEAAAPSTPISEITTTKQIKTFKSNSYSNGYNNTTYSDLAFCIVNGSDTNGLKQALEPLNINSNIYKFLIINGDCTLDWNIGNNAFNNFIIYCTGTINLNYIDLSFNNSAIITKNANIKPSSSFIMTQLNSTQYTSSIKNEINTLCNQYLN
ncbi:prepilin-type N-terminal cleavage/methylation domain-containing protein [Clostridium sp. WILCCON 0269]|uniref:Prepilin-type N-terminal cleavage/methylation domain-containing protein n=1 Tax=Candidatus Clostridium eludens TaxID=3381663 RepID=A0ABW8SJB5_9CLOT